MTNANPEDSAIGLEIVSTEERATAVIIQQVPPSKRQQYLAWQRGISAAACRFPGYQRTEVFPPTSALTSEWVAILYFSNSKNLSDWLSSSARKEWTQRLKAEFGEFQMRQFAGMGEWFRPQSSPSRTSEWKVALTVLLGLYPTVMILSRLLAEPLASLPFAARLLVSNILSICLLQWGVMPALTRLLNPWLVPGPKPSLAKDLLGACAILGMLALLLLVFLAI